MKHGKTWLFLAIAGFAIASGLPDRASGGGNLTSLSNSDPSPTASASEPSDRAPVHEEPPSPLRLHWQSLRPVLVDYETARVNSTVMIATAQARREGKQPLDVIREWQRGIVNNYLYEVRHGQGEPSQRLRQDLLTRYGYTLLAESVLTQGKPLQPVNIDERAIACDMVGYLQLNSGGYCDADG